jgi:hypothetical protein
MATTEPLTEQEQQALEQMRQAQEQGSTLKELAARLGLEVSHLYEIRRRLVRKGAFGPPPPTQNQEAPQDRRIRAGTGGACGADAEGPLGRVPTGASWRLGARVRWIAAGDVDRSGVGRRGSCCVLVHRT